MGKNLVAFCGIILICNLLLFGTLPVSADTGQEAVEVSVEEAAERVVDGRFDVLLDVRQPEEYELLRIPGAILIPLNTLKKEAREKLNDPDDSILTYSSVGNRSVEAAKILRDMGYKHVVSLKGGIVAWDEKGFPVAK